MELINELSNLIPSKYWPFIILALPYVGRSYHAIVTGGGLRGFWRAIWLGTNTPKNGK